MLTQDVTAVVRKAWEKHGVTPDDLFGRLTPSQFVALFTAPPHQAFDRVEELVKHNRARGRRGLRPAIPSWL